MKNIICTVLALLFSTLSMASEIKDPQPKDLIQSPASPYYFCYQEDMADLVKRYPKQQVNTLLAIGAHGRINIDLMARRVAALQEKLDLHKKIATLFFDDLVPKFKTNNYVGTQIGLNNEINAGWFGGISIYTIGVLDDLMKVQDALPKAKKMRFMGIGSGNAFFEYLLSKVGETTAMDVIQTESIGDKDSLNGYDSRNLMSMEADERFYMNVTIHQSQSPEDLDRIVSETFSDADYQNTILVLSWPREFAMKYIHKFFEKGGKSIIFIRNQVVGSIFDKSHLGEIDGSNAEFKKFLAKKHKISMNLNTSTASTLDFYSRTENSPVEQALRNTAGRLLLK